MGGGAYGGERGVASSESLLTGYDARGDEH